MKKTFVAALAALALVSCSKEETVITVRTVSRWTALPCASPLPMPRLRVHP